MEKNTKILLGIGAVIAAYLILKPKKAAAETTLVNNPLQADKVPATLDVNNCDEVRKLYEESLFSSAYKWRRGGGMPPLPNWYDMEIINFKIGKDGWLVDSNESETEEQYQAKMNAKKEAETAQAIEAAAAQKLRDEAYSQIKSLGLLNCYNAWLEEREYDALPQ
jgi:hypothetical protein